jgi:hypothetical protein
MAIGAAALAAVVVAPGPRTPSGKEKARAAAAHTAGPQIGMRSRASAASSGGRAAGVA